MADFITEFFGTENVRTKTGEMTPQDAFKNTKMIAIYFSMHNCPPCRQFTPLFAELFNEINKDFPENGNRDFEVIFVSGDKTDEEYNEYYGEMPWYALPRGDKRLAGLAKKFEVKGVPRLVLVKKDGTVLH